MRVAGVLWADCAQNASKVSILELSVVSGGAGGVEEVWCVFDIDEHPLIPEAKDQARANGIEMAISNPCFELWALLHFQDQRAHIEQGKVQQSRRQRMPGYEKRVPHSHW
jgi:hypothetical protein